MKQVFTCLLTLLSFVTPTAYSAQRTHDKPFTGSFNENKGQVCDQHGSPRPDVLFSTHDGKIVTHFRKNGISYQLEKIESYKKETAFGLKVLNETERLIPENISVYRLDLEWPGVNEAAQIVADKQLPGASHFYLSSCPDGATNVRSFSEIKYKELYTGIDLHYYFRDGHLKYDYLVAPFADHNQIRIQVKGCTAMAVDNDGSLILSTPIGQIKEAAPVVYQSGRRLKSNWVLKDNELTFNISGRNLSLPMVIDPLVRNWGTYYGGSLEEEGRGCATDAAGNIYMAGKSKSTTGIATTGSYQTALAGANADAFLVKFDAQGVRLWATYYGGTGEESGNACAVDGTGNCWVVGTTSASSTGIATAGTAHQGFNAGQSDAMIVKFSPAGLRLWGSYYGGTSQDQFLSVAINGSNVYACGHTGSNGTGFPANAIATPGAHQTTHGTGFLVKFNLSGARQWGTYYGDGIYDPATCVTIDLNGDVYMGGQTYANTNIATPGAHQTTLNGFYDAYLVKFNPAGVRQWGTYYGDISLEGFQGLATDASANVYAVGITGSPSNIATTGAHQTLIGMALNGDGMVIKFNSAGVRQWGTYYGGNTDDLITSCVIAPSGDLFFAGLSNSPAGIATTDGLQTTLSSQDAFLAHFNQAGVRQWATYYGSTGSEKANAVAAGPNGEIYMCGFGAAAAILSTAGSHQTVYGGGNSDGFLAQFKPCTPPAAPVNMTSAGNMTACANLSTSLTVSGTGTVSWFGAALSTVVIGTGTFYTTPILSAGTHTFYVSDENSCLSSPRTPITVTVAAIPVVSISASPAGVCPGGTLVLTASGATQYSWSTNAATSSIAVAPVAGSVFSVKGTSVGCSSQATVSNLVYAIPALSITPSKNFICVGETVSLTASGATSYTWNSVTQNAVVSISPNVPTVYTLTGISTQSCSATSTILITPLACAGIGEHSESQVKVFPNPFHDVLNVSLTGSAEMEILNVLGQSLRKQTLTDEERIELSSLPAGLYFLSIELNGKKVSYRVVKE